MHRCSHHRRHQTVAAVRSRASQRGTRHRRRHSGRRRRGKEGSTHVRAYAPGNVRDCRPERPLLRHRWATVELDSAARTHSGAWRMTGQLKRAPAEETMHSPPEGTKTEYPEEPRRSYIPCVPRVRQKAESKNIDQPTKLSAKRCVVFCLSHKWMDYKGQLSPGDSQDKRPGLT